MGTTALIQVTNASLVGSNLADLSPPSMCAMVGPGSTAVSYRPLVPGASGGVVYLSFLINFPQPPGSYYIAGLLQGTNAPPGGAADDPLDLIDNTSGSGYKLGVRAKGGATSYVGSARLPMTVNTTYFVVMKYDFTSGQASLYLNPLPGSAEPAAADAASTAATPVPDLQYLYLRSGSSSAGTFLISTLRVATTWEEVTPASLPVGQLVFTGQPGSATAGIPLSAVMVTLHDRAGNPAPSNNVPVSVSLNSGVFAGGATTVRTGPDGQATFTGLIIDAAGTYTLTAAASGFGTVTSAPFVVGPGAAGTNITANGARLNAFLDSLQVDKYWIGGKTVNWLTGAAGGSGPNKTLGSATHCSAFAAAVAELLGIYLLRPPDASDLNLANNQADWFVTNTAGWFAITNMVSAQHWADNGTLVMASYKASGGSGHIAVLRASNRPDADVTAFGPEECQSGENNFADTNIVTGFNQHAGAFPNNIRYYGHAVAWPVPLPVPAFGAPVISNQLFCANVSSIVGRKYQIQSSADLVNWIPWLTYTNANSPATFFMSTSFSNAVSGPRKFYRLLAE